MTISPVSAPHPAYLARALDRLAPQARRVASLSASATPAQARAARVWARGVLDTWGLPEEAAGDVLLVVAELAANAAEHGGEEMTVTLVLGPHAVRVLVADSGTARAPGWPVPEHPAGPWEERGRGLALVRALAHFCEVDPHADTGGVHVRADVLTAAG
ncbi:ATP-binding protein [Streptomyces sp. TRM 70351]|uniref:ATP-binding protein n=1 Tax=Streptomyces sp. TRM 70351 TaxID=3116552 RepID=UPI002E7C2BDF|nr:ATP-binding protein [Streptomyces sp. TRM 70351]MEE1928978.1 ATP-binding protein [Streptomyces sp. TRM 70351]